MKRDPSRRDGLEIADLLTIDVAAEVRKLSRAQLESPAQLPVELVRRAFAAGAALADVRCDRRGVAVRDDGAPIPEETLDALAALLDVSGAQNGRHHALLRLEASGDLALLALAGVELAALRVRSGGRVLQMRRGERPAISEAAGGGTTIEIGGAPLDPAAVRDAVRLSGRFARGQIRIDGSPLPVAAFGDVLFEDAITAPIPGRLAFPAAGDAARVWILLDGITAAHIALPGLPCFEAAVEARAIFPRGRPLPPPSALREAVEPHLGAITERALEKMERAASNLEAIAADRHARVREWVVTAIRKKMRVPSMRAARVFPVLTRNGAETRRVSLDELAALARESSSGLVALFPEQDPAKFLLPAGAVPVLDTVERGRLAPLVGVSFRAPPPRRAEGGAIANLRASLASARHDLLDGVRRLLHPFEGRPVPDDSLSTIERAFIATLREHAMTESCEDLAVRFVEGSGPVRQLTRPGPTLLLPRSNPVVRAALTTLAHDRSWVYPVALALDAIPRPATRSLWQSGNRI